MENRGTRVGGNNENAEIAKVNFLVSKYKYTILGLCSFIWFLSFKPSEPYLSQFLICNFNTQNDFCSGVSKDSCNAIDNPPCYYSFSSCSPLPCNNISIISDNCGNSDYNYCITDGNQCTDAFCYKNFSENQVNNEIYTWSTYFYLPFLVILGPFAEIFSYRFAILFGISGRVVTRFILLYGNTLTDMQVMQVLLYVCLS